MASLVLCYIHHVEHVIQCVRLVPSEVTETTSLWGRKDYYIL